MLDIPCKITGDVSSRSSRHAMQKAVMNQARFHMEDR
jgi:hypothetical protein